MIKFINSLVGLAILIALLIFLCTKSSYANLIVQNNFYSNICINNVSYNLVIFDLKKYNNKINLCNKINEIIQYLSFKYENIFNHNYIEIYHDDDIAYIYTYHNIKRVSCRALQFSLF